MVACSVRTKDGTIRDWKEQSTFCKKLDARRAAARIQFEERMGGDGWRVGASFLHRHRRLFTLTLKPRRRATSPRARASASVRASARRAVLQYGWYSWYFWGRGTRPARAITSYTERASGGALDEHAHMYM